MSWAKRKLKLSFLSEALNPRLLTEHIHIAHVIPGVGCQIDPAEQDSRNDLSHYTVDGQALWGRAYTYCTADPSIPIECDEGTQYLEAANETLPELLRSADGTLEFEQYREQVRGICVGSCALLYKQTDIGHPYK